MTQPPSLSSGETLSASVIVDLCRAGEAVLLLLSGAAAWSFMGRIGTPLPLGLVAVVTFVGFCLAEFVLARRSAYRMAHLLAPRTQVVAVALAILTGGAAMAACLLLLGLKPSSALAESAAWGVASAETLAVFRFAAGAQLRHAQRQGRLARRVAIVGVNDFSLSFVEQARNDPSVTVIGLYDDRSTRLPSALQGVSICGSVADLLAHSRQQLIDAIVVALPLTAPDRIAELQRQLASVVADIYVTTDVAGLRYPGAQFTSLGPTPVIAVASRPMKDWAALQKLAFDWTVSLVLLVAGLPFLAVIALVIRLDSPGPVIVRQQRHGFNNRLFTMFKFRTMHTRGRRPGDDAIQATRGDARVTRIGGVLRRLSLDELPQLVNVLLGDMSLVGPRPHLPTTRAGDRLFHDVVPEYDTRHRVKPGITGWAQIHGLRGETRTEAQIEQRVAYDLYYISHWSMGLDLRIILKTILNEIISRSGNAY
ncbi:MAG: exopolysaccharide biosynthesis polyprenyl glycosylphosphotransferase [Acetobacteraceae bacterium]